MLPSSLIFVVIIAVWAAYVIQHWIRRRDHVATARSVDRFSEAMRVLERRRVMPQLSISTPKTRSYAVSIARPAHPDVVVKRAQPGPAVAAGEPPPPARPSRSRPAPRARRTRVSAPRLAPALLRATALVVGALAAAAGVGLYLSGRLPWWSAAGGGTAFLLAFSYIRWSVGRSRRRASSPVRPPAAKPAAPPRRPARRANGGAPVTATPVAAARVRGSAPVYVSPVTARPVIVDTPEDAAPVVAERPAAARSDLYDVQAVEAAHAARSERAAAPAPESGELAPGTWQPVPVPPPTYTLKAKAPRARATAVPVDTPVDELPFDGNALALDEEFEELPAVHHAG